MLTKQLRRGRDFVGFSLNNYLLHRQGNDWTRGETLACDRSDQVTGQDGSMFSWGPRWWWMWDPVPRLTRAEAWALAQNWHLQSLTLVTLDLGPVWSRLLCASGFHVCHGAARTSPWRDSHVLATALRWAREVTEWNGRSFWNWPNTDWMKLVSRPSRKQGLHISHWL